MKSRRRGFALVFVLWIMVAAASLALTVTLAARDEITAVQNRHASDRARWMAQGCVERARAAVEGALWEDGFSAASVRSGWNDLDRLMVPVMNSASLGCSISIDPVGLTLDINSANPAQLRRLVERLAPNADSIVDAIVDWRDADDRPRTSGAERPWYVGRGLIPPGNGPFVAPAEIMRVRGMTQAVAAALGVQKDRILWRRANAPVLAALPGMTDEALAVLGSHDPGQISDLSALASFPELSAGARDSLARASHVLIPMITSTPEAWVISARAAYGAPGIEQTVTMRVALGDRRLLILERRMLP